ncbi:DUF1223 domain-containing protein [Erythrobacter sp. SDW2]|uniref:DUF1223 domain-containing protein n=1 Tax=Erythrobacter sp. SDW2 TaxID=2907154 RepID=UPI001F2F17BB|nr:DUF1223 domain-containing protein [Erythrobacter sp. SDW2]UIP07198.1 DUF1223 domain-containing protein [Erythrobacter sp. SDW2]
MQKLIWIALATGAALFTAATVAMNDTADMALQRAKPAAAAPLDGKRPVVVEFFTSQGCSSCPPSDRLAAKLAREPGVLVIQRPVTYGDRLGWADTLASPTNTALQQAYARSGLAGRNGVYTPQAVIAGRGGLVGSQERALRQQIAEAGKLAAPAVRLRTKPDGVTEIMIDGTGIGRAQVLLVGLDSDETVSVSRGENGGRSLSYTNIWKGERALGTLSGGEASFMVDAAEKIIAGANRYAVIVRQGKAGPILAGQILP